MFMNDYPAGLVAPRPVRYTQQHNGFVTRSHSAKLLSAVDQFDRLRITENNDDNSNEDYRTSPIERDLASPRSASRASLPSEALEEFLSILRPSFFPPSSPNSMRSRRQSAAGSYTHERSYSFKARIQKSDIYTLDELDRDRSMQLSRNSNVSGEGEIEAARWYNSSALSSPVSRMHTRNPFQRHPSYDYEVTFSGDHSTFLLPPSESPNGNIGRGLSLSPSAVPLPSPSPEEMMSVM